MRWEHKQLLFFFSRKKNTPYSEENKIQIYRRCLIMKNLLSKLEVTEKDNLVSAAAKGGMVGYLKYSAGILPIIAVLGIIGKCISSKEELKKFEEDMGA